MAQKRRQARKASRRRRKGIRRMGRRVAGRKVRGALRGFVGATGRRRVSSEELRSRGGCW